MQSAAQKAQTSKRGDTGPAFTESPSGLILCRNSRSGHKDRNIQNSAACGKQHIFLHSF